MSVSALNTGNMNANAKGTAKKYVAKNNQQGERSSQIGPLHDPVTWYKIT